LQINIDYSSPA